MNLGKLLARVTGLVLWAGNASAYEVWMGTHLSTHTMATTPADWSLTASKLEGININRAPHDTDPATTADWQSMLPRYTNAGSKMVEMARSEPTKNPALVDELAFPAIAAELTQKVQEARNYGFSFNILMFYDETGTYQGTDYLYEWTNTEVQYLRDWLDSNGLPDVKLMWNVRNNSTRNQQMAANPVVDMVEIEASTTALLANTNNQVTFFTWFWNNPATVNKRIALQIPRTLDSITQYAGTRRVAQMLGGIIGYGDAGMRSSRLVFLPVTYNDNYPYIPEFNSPTSYKNTLTSICLSLIEQRDLFEGRLPTLPTVAHADSLSRNLSPTISGIGDQVLAQNASSDPLAFTVADDQTAAASLRHHPNVLEHDPCPDRQYRVRWQRREPGGDRHTGRGTERDRQHHRHRQRRLLDRHHHVHRDGAAAGHRARHALQQHGGCCFAERQRGARLSGHRFAGPDWPRRYQPRPRPFAGLCLSIAQPRS